MTKALFRPASELPANADSDSRYTHGLHLVQIGAKSVRGAAIEVGLDPSNFRRKLIRMKANIPDAEQRHRASEERILTAAEDLNEASASKLMADVEDGCLKHADLIKTFSVSANVISAKRRWAQGISTGADRTQDALAGALEQLRKGASIRIEEPDRVETAIDVTPASSTNTKGGQ